MNEVLKRSLTGIVFISILVFAILKGLYGLTTLGLLVSYLGATELLKMALPNAGVLAQRLAGLLASFLFLILLAANNVLIDPIVFAGAFSLITLIGVLLLFFYKTDITPNVIAYSCLAALYVAGGMAAINYLQHTHGLVFNGYLVLAFFVSVWTNDTMAYVCGRLFGKNKLYPSVSPNKTIEGFVGGVLFAGLAMAIFGYLNASLSWQVIVLGLLIGIASTVGDLFESYLKRYFEVKDSGNILPGHGGILDRFDGVLFAAPISYLYLQLIL